MTSNEAIDNKMQQLVSELAERNKELIVAAEFGSMLLKENAQLKNTQKDLIMEREAQQNRVVELTQQVRQWKQKATRASLSYNSPTQDNTDEDDQVIEFDATPFQNSRSTPPRSLRRSRSSSGGNTTFSSTTEVSDDCKDYNDDTSMYSKDTDDSIMLTPRRSPRDRDVKLVKEQSKRIQLLEDEIAQVTQRLEFANEAMSEKNRQCEKLQKVEQQLSACKEELKRLGKQNEQLRTTIKEKGNMEELLSKVTRANHSLRSECEELREMYRDLQHQQQSSLNDDQDLLRVDQLSNDMDQSSQTRLLSLEHDAIVQDESSPQSSTIHHTDISSSEAHSTNCKPKEQSKTISESKEQSTIISESREQNSQPFGENFDAMFFHFHLLTQTVKMELESTDRNEDDIHSTFGLSTEFLNTINSKDLYEEMLKVELPFHEWSNWVRRELTRQYCTAQREIQQYHQESSTVTKARELLEQGIISKEEFQHIAKADRAISLESQQLPQASSSTGACEA